VELDGGLAPDFAGGGKSIGGGETKKKGRRKREKNGRGGAKQIPKESAVRKAKPSTI